ncbi:hypothetical protein SAMN02745127_03187 [Oceanospirillum multiglobuliferum]|uniref:Uncharacterized protein n=1 Tax=Oceanospirillum multiglobuliferum TaxID=64969 RepID=A0A1T4SM80_9GAMM|nr:hypothetical protein [Oceanospirillum multiglobuliferum]OPX54173.1 hypothetical protein BTE48_15550 [Oceanospirillum multiglobuliferum]SKA29404.1 hypothetical protein SAMN02745127_03187 [Oceanospirillum multiglobuliferum]
MEELFNKNQSKTVLGNFKLKVNDLTPADDFERQRNSLILLVVSSMSHKPDQWDKLCQINIQWIGSYFINRLADEQKELSKERLDDICAMCFRFLFELYLSMKDNLAEEFETARQFVFNNVDSFEKDAKEKIEYAIRDMPISIFKAIANSDAIDSLKNFNSVSAKAEKLKDDWESDLSRREARVNSLKESLSKYENAFNFVGLYQGFDELSGEKKAERDGILLWLRVLSVLIVSPIVAELIFVYMHLDNIATVRDGLLVSIFPTVSLVAISVYYFRVLLFNYKSVKSQLLQIDLRKTLCRFIQSYSEYSSELKRKDANSLDKFESIVFSGIVTDDGSLPSTFDGMNQIEKLIKAAKS